MSNNKIFVFLRLFIMVGVFACILASTPSMAEAQTVEEIQAAIEETEAAIAETEENYKSALSSSSSVAVELYKCVSSNNILNILDTLLSANDINDIIDGITYMSALGADYSEKMITAQSRQEELEEKREELAELYAAAEAREKMWENAASCHYQQGGGMPWSSLSYWNSTVSRSGCGLCAYTVMVNILTGSNYTPSEMLDIRGDWRGMEKSVTDKTGTGSKTHYQFTLDTFDIESYTTDTRDAYALAEELEQGETVAIVCAQGTIFHNSDGSYYYTSGHYVVVYKVEGEDYFHVQDSAISDANVTYTYSEIQKVLNRTNSIVLFSN